MFWPLVMLLEAPRMGRVAELRRSARALSLSREAQRHAYASFSIPLVHLLLFSSKKQLLESIRAAFRDIERV